MTTSAWIDELERELQLKAALLTGVHEGECLACYVARTVSELGCDTTGRWLARYQAFAVPRATQLLRRLGERGAFCDCELFLNVLHLEERWLPLTEAGVDVEAWSVPACFGVRRGSSQPCRLWEVRRPW